VRVPGFRGSGVPGFRFRGSRVPVPGFQGSGFGVPGRSSGVPARSSGFRFSGSEVLQTQNCMSRSPSGSRKYFARLITVRRAGPRSRRNFSQASRSEEAIDRLVDHLPPRTTPAIQVRPLHKQILKTQCHPVIGSVSRPTQRTSEPRNPEPWNPGTGTLEPRNPGTPEPSIDTHFLSPIFLAVVPVEC
jgi:hypothetical protein